MARDAFDPDLSDQHAKLLAYVEGDMPPKEAAAFRKELERHPDHSRLLEQLKRDRLAVQTLPLFHAPDDVADGVRAHLERSALLADPPEALRMPRRWLTSVVAVAASMVLAGGLGYAVWSTIPRGNGQEFSMDVPAAPSAAEVAEDDRSRAAPPAELEAPALTRTMADETPPLAFTPQQREELRGQFVRSMESILSLASRLPAPASPIDDDAETRSSPAVEDVVDGALANARRQWPALSAAPAVVVVDAADNTLANAQVVQFLEGNRIEFETVGADLPQAGMVASEADGSQLTIARNMSVLQAQQLVDVLNTPHDQHEAARQGYVQRMSDAQQLSPQAMEQAPPAEAKLVQQVARRDNDLITPRGPGIRAGETLEVVVAELVGPGLKPNMQVPVAADGTLRLPMLDPIAVENLSPAEATERIAEAYHREQLIDSPTVSVNVVQPATQQAEATRQAEAAPPEQQAAAADEAVNVLILVKQRTPSTQPAE